MVSKDVIDERTTIFRKLQKNDPSFDSLITDLYDRFQIYWKNISPSSIFLRNLVEEYVQYLIITQKDPRYELLLDVLMELYNESLQKNKSKTLDIFSHTLTSTPYFENFWAISLDGGNKKIDLPDIRIRIRKKLSLYKEFAEGMFKYVAPYSISCLSLIENKNLSFDKISSYDLGTLVSIMTNTNYSGFSIITKTKTGLSINTIRNVNAHSSIRTFPNGKIEFIIITNNKKRKISINEKDLDDDLRHLIDVDFIIKFSIALFSVDNFHDLHREYNDDDIQPETCYLFLATSFTKFQFTVGEPPSVSDSTLIFEAISLTDSDSTDILVRLSLHLPILYMYAHMTKILESLSKIRIIGKNKSEKEVGYVEITIDSINKARSNSTNYYEVLLKYTTFVDLDKNTPLEFFHEKSLELLRSENEKLDNLKNMGLLWNGN